MSELNSAISKIGDNWTISRDAIQELEKVLPGALENYTVFADGTIKLDEEKITSLLKVRRSHSCNCQDLAFGGGGSDDQDSLQ